MRSVSATVRTTNGPVQGSFTDGVHAFLGIPYAAPPVGAAAFRAPEPHPDWTGDRPATEYGPTAPQIPYPAPIAALLENAIVPGPDYLNLNVWTPEVGDVRLPVLVWIHGGAFARGSNRLKIYRGNTFARDGVVVVGVNYRRGFTGFASIADAPDNRGLLDQIFALEWVRENIAAFGGDPRNITIFGESAGAMSVASLLSSPRARGLFHRAIMQSGNGSVGAARGDACALTDRMAAKLGVAATSDGFAGVATDALLEAQTAIALELMQNPDPAEWGESIISLGLGLMSFFPTLDDDVLPAVPVEAIEAGAGRGIPLVAGWNTDEFRFFHVPTGITAAATTELAQAVLRNGGIDPGLLDPSLAPGDALAAVLTDQAFRIGTCALVDAQRANETDAFLYEFAWPSGIPGLGACHALELPFVFDRSMPVPRSSGRSHLESWRTKCTRRGSLSRRRAGPAGSPESRRSSRREPSEAFRHRTLAVRL